jgi:predicted nucleic acid-binding protein
VTLCDTGPLVALIDRDDVHHARCVATLDALPPKPLLTTIPCFTEAMYLVGRAGGFTAQDELWSLHVDGLVDLHVGLRRLFALDGHFRVYRLHGRDSFDLIP